MTVGVRINVRSKSSGETIEGWKEAVRNTRPGIEAVAGVMRERIVEQFQARVDPWLVRWPALKESTRTIAAKRGIVPGGLGILNTILFQISTDGRGLEISFGTRTAEPFHFGVPNARVFGRATATIPPRPILPVRNGRLDVPDALSMRIRAAFRDAMKRAASAGRRAATRPQSGGMI